MTLWIEQLQSTQELHRVSSCDENIDLYVETLLDGCTGVETLLNGETSSLVAEAGWACKEVGLPGFKPRHLVVEQDGQQWTGGKGECCGG